MPALAAAGLAALLLLASRAGVGPFAAGLVLLAGILGFAGIGGSGRPGAAAAGAVAGTAGAAAVVAVLVTGDEEHAAAVVPVLAIAVVAAAVTQLVRRDGRAGLVDALTGTVAGAAAAVLPAFWVAVRQGDSGERAVAAALIASGVAALAAAGVAILPAVRRGSVRVRTAGVAAGLVLGVLAGWLATSPPGADGSGLVAGSGSGPGLGHVTALVLAAVAAAAASAVLAGSPFAETPLRACSPVQRVALLATLPLVVPAPVVYVVARLALG